MPRIEPTKEERLVGKQGHIELEMMDTHEKARQEDIDNDIQGANDHMENLLKITTNEANPVAPMALVAMRQDAVFQAIRGYVFGDVVGAPAMDVQQVRRKPTEDEYPALADAIANKEWHLIASIRSGFTGKPAIKCTPDQEIWECTHSTCTSAAGDPTEIYPGDEVTVTRQWLDNETTGQYREFSVLCTNKPHIYKKREDVANDSTSGSTLENAGGRAG